MIDPFTVRVSGPLSSYAHGFAAEMLREGYSRRTVRDHVYALSWLSRWLAAEGLTAAQLRPEVVDRFLLARRVSGRRRWRTRRSLQPMLTFLLGVRAIPSPQGVTPATALDALLVDYRRYLVDERRLATVSVTARVAVARKFLTARDRGGELLLAQLGPSDVSGFVLGELPRYRRSSMKALSVALRCLLRFLFRTGLVERDLSAAVPAIAHRASGLPLGVDTATVAALLEACDLSRPVGLRDRAVVTLLVRLGLRAAEVAGLCLDDVDWRSGELVIHGKGNRFDRLPLPADVGAVLVGYLRHGRPRSSCRSLFLRACAPYEAMTARSVTMVPRAASRRAGLAIIGAHRLRHTAATGMLRAGAPLPEIAQALRHHSEASTARYAAVDRAALEAVVRPWPGAQR